MRSVIHRGFGIAVSGKSGNFLTAFAGSRWLLQAPTLRRSHMTCKHTPWQYSPLQKISPQYFSFLRNGAIRLFVVEKCRDKMFGFEKCRVMIVHYEKCRNIIAHFEKYRNNIFISKNIATICSLLKNIATLGLIHETCRDICLMPSFTVKSEFAV